MTFAVKVCPGIASIVTLAVWPRLTVGISVSSTSTSASITDMSAITSRTVPGLFMVPVTAVSPCSMLRRVTMPLIGDSIRTRLRSYFALDRVARSCMIVRSCVLRFCSCERRFACCVFKSFSARSRTSRGVRPCLESCNCRL